MKYKIKSLLLGWAIHYGLIQAAIIMSYVVPPYMGAFPLQKTPWQYFVEHTFHDADSLVLIFCILSIELNYQYLFKKLRLMLFVISCILVGILSLIALYYLNLDRFEDRYIPLEVVWYVAGYAFVYSVIRNYLHQTGNKKDIQLQQSTSELDALKAQLNPHFLFNSLNYLYGTALTEKAPQTADGIEKLSEMMRYTITGIHENFVPLENEINFIERYLALQLARLPEKESIKIDIQISASSESLLIAPLLFLPFIENAFKYGISMDEPCFIHLKIALIEFNLTMEISNSVNNRPMEIKGNNTGIKNAVKRLNLLYPDTHKLKQTNTTSEYTTLLTLRLRSKK